MTKEGGGAIYIESESGTFSATKLDISYCLTNGTGGALSLVSVDASISSSSFSNNEATGNGGGAIYCSNCLLSFSQGTIKYNTATNGGLMLIDNYHDVSFTSSNFTSNSASNKGGGFSI